MLARTKAGLNTKLHAAVDGRSQPRPNRPACSRPLLPACSLRPRASPTRHPQKQFPSRQVAFNEKTDFTTISIRNNTIKTLLKQLRTEVK
jgi:hypothetical protein